MNLVKKSSRVTLAFSIGSLEDAKCWLPTSRKYRQFCIWSDGSLVLILHSPFGYVGGFQEAVYAYVSRKSGLALNIYQ